MLNKSAIQQILNQNREKIAAHGVKSLALFGSFVRGDSGPRSDLDFLVEYNRPTGLFDHAGMQIFLKNLFGKKIDLVTPTGLHPALRNQILAEAEKIYEG